MRDYNITELLLHNNQWLVSACLVMIILLSWWYLLEGAGTGMDTLAMTRWQIIGTDVHSAFVNNWNAEYFITMLMMWWIMMIGMMLPGAAPIILLYALVYRNEQKKQNIKQRYVPTTHFVLGYLIIWFLFSILAVGLQYWLETQNLLHGMMMWLTYADLSAVVLVLVGIYQLTPLKNRCLEHCRNPSLYIQKHWAASTTGAFGMGVRHGLYCVGCCWGLMILLFVGGIMNLVWIAGLTIVVLLEKLITSGKWLGQMIGFISIMTGLLFFVR